jgi:hypothetical protein
VADSNDKRKVMVKLEKKGRQFALDLVPVLYANVLIILIVTSFWVRSGDARTGQWFAVSRPYRKSSVGARHYELA